MCVRARKYVQCLSAQSGRQLNCNFMLFASRVNLKCLRVAAMPSGVTQHKAFDCDTHRVLKAVAINYSYLLIAPYIKYVTVTRVYVKLRASTSNVGHCCTFYCNANRACSTIFLFEIRACAIEYYHLCFILLNLHTITLNQWVSMLFPNIESKFIIYRYITVIT